MKPFLNKAKGLLSLTENINLKVKALIELDQRLIVLREDLTQVPFTGLTVLRQAMVLELDGIEGHLREGEDDAASMMIDSYENRITVIMPYASRLHDALSMFEKQGTFPIGLVEKARPMMNDIENDIARAKYDSVEEGFNSLKGLLSYTDIKGHDRFSADDKSVMGTSSRTCRFCQSALSDSAEICPFCGFPPEADIRVCPKCRSVAMATFDFCPFCASALSGIDD